METTTTKRDIVYTMEVKERHNIDIRIGGITVSTWGTLKIERASEYEGYYCTIKDKNGSTHTSIHIHDEADESILIDYFDSDVKKFTPVFSRR